MDELNGRHELEPHTGVLAQRAPNEAIYLRAAQDGAAARRRGEPRDPSRYLPRYAGQPSLVSPEAAWLAAYDRMGELLAPAPARRWQP